MDLMSKLQNLRPAFKAAALVGLGALSVCAYDGLFNTPMNKDTKCPAGTVPGEFHELRAEMTHKPYRDRNGFRYVIANCYRDGERVYPFSEVLGVR